MGWIGTTGLLLSSPIPFPSLIRRLPENQAVSGPAALVGIRNGGREGIRTPGLLIANSRENKLRQGAPQSLSYFNGALNWQTWQTRLFAFFFILPALWVAEFLLCRFQND